MTLRHPGPNGFTLIECVPALAVASIALLALLRLQLVGISTADKARGLTQAVLVAQGKMAETLSAEYPSVGTTSGMVADGRRAVHLAGGGHGRASAATGLGGRHAASLSTVFRPARGAEALGRGDLAEGARRQTRRFDHLFGGERNS